MDSSAISQDIAELRDELSTLRGRMQDDSSSFSTLEEQIAEVRQRLEQTQESVKMRELRLAEKQAELEEAKRLERLGAYKGQLSKYRELRAAVSTAATDFLSHVEAYDAATAALSDLLAEMRAAFGEDERVYEVWAALVEEQVKLRSAWDALDAALQGRAEASPSPAPDDAGQSNGRELPDELLVEAEEMKPRARILDYFAKS